MLTVLGKVVFSHGSLFQSKYNSGLQSIESIGIVQFECDIGFSEGDLTAGRSHLRASPSPFDTVAKVFQVSAGAVCSQICL